MSFIGTKRLALFVYWKWVCFIEFHGIFIITLEGVIDIKESLAEDLCFKMFQGPRLSFLALTICFSVKRCWQVHNTKKPIPIPFWNLLIFLGKWVAFWNLQASSKSLAMKESREKTLAHLGFHLFHTLNQNILNSPFFHKNLSTLDPFPSHLLSECVSVELERRLTSENGVSHKHTMLKDVPPFSPTVSPTRTPWLRSCPSLIPNYIMSIVRHMDLARIV